MTELLRHAIMEIEKLPADVQNAVASRILTDLEDGQAWAARFAATSNEQWNRLAEMARQEIAAGDSTPLEDATSSVQRPQAKRLPALLDKIASDLRDAPALSDEAVSRAGIYSDHP